MRFNAIFYITTRNTKSYGGLLFEIPHFAETRFALEKREPLGKRV
jgi:hypothetical protein